MPSGFDKNDFIIDTRATGVEETKKQLDSVGTVLEKLDKQTQSLRITFGRMTAGLGKNIDQLSSSFSSFGKTISSALSKQTQTLGNYIVTGSPYSNFDLSQFRELSKAMKQARIDTGNVVVEEAKLGKQSIFNRMKNGYKDVSKSIKDTSKQQKSLTKSIRNTVLAFVSIRTVARFMSQAIQTSASFTENLNLFAVTFNREYEDTLDWTLELADNLGLSVNEVIRMTGLFKQLSSAIGITGEQGTELAKTFTRLSYDWASFYNYQVGEVYSKIQAGIFSGQVRTLRTMGIDVSMESVDSLIRYNKELRELGISSRSLNQEQKVLARTILSLDASINALGNMTAEIDTLENRIRVLRSSWENFKLAVGDIFYEPFRQGLAYINGFMQALTTAIRAFVPYREETEDSERVLNSFIENYIESFKRLHEAEGLDWSDLLEEQYREEAIKAFDGAMDDVEQSFNKVNNLSFDKFESLSVGESLTQTEKEKAINEALNKVLEDRLGTYAQLTEYTHRIDEETLSVRENILGWIFPSFKDFDGSFEDFKKEFGTLDEETGRYELGILDLNSTLKLLSDTFKTIRETAGDSFKIMADALPAIIDALSGVFSLLSNIVVKLNESGMLKFAIQALIIGNAVSGIIAPMSGLLGIVKNMATAFKALSVAGGAVTAVIAIIGILYTTNEEFRESINGLIKTLADGLVPIINILVDFISRLFTALGPLLNTLIDALTPILLVVLDAVMLLIDALLPLIDIILPIFTIMLGLNVEWLLLLADALTGVLKILKPVFDLFAKFIDLTFNKPFKFIMSLFSPGSSGGGIGRVTGYADGGMPAKSELFYMNEYGVPEALVNTGGSETNVINQQQMIQLTKAGFLEAINESGLLNSQNTRIVLEGRNIDNNSLARGIFPALKIESRNRGGNQL